MARRRGPPRFGRPRTQRLESAHGIIGRADPDVRVAARSPAALEGRDRQQPDVCDRLRWSAYVSGVVGRNVTFHLLPRSEALRAGIDDHVGLDRDPAAERTTGVAPIRWRELAEFGS